MWACKSLMYLCVRSTGLLLGSVGGSLTYIALLWCVWGLPICPWAVSVDLSCIDSFIVFDVMCVRCADLLLGCVGGPLTHHLVCYGVWWGLPTCSWAVSVGLSLCRIFSFCCGHISGSLMHYLHIHCICVIIDVLVCEVHRPAPGQCRWVSHIYCFAVVCVRSTDLPVGCVGGSLMHRLIYCIWCDVCEVCRPAPGLRRWTSHASSGMLWCVMRSADLLLGCVGGSLSLCRIISFCCGHISGSLMHYLHIHVFVLLLMYCVWGPPACSWAVSVGLSHILLCCGVCEVYRFARGLCRWISHASSHLLYLMWCVWGVPTCSWVASVDLSCIIWYVMVCNEVCRPAPGLCRWVSLSLSHYLILLWCVWGLPICSWVMSVDLSRIYPILFLMCVGSTDLLLGYVGGPLMHRLNFYGVCEVYRPAPGLCRWVSHFSHFNILIFCFVVIWLW